MKKLDEMYKEFDKNVDKLFEQEIKNPNAKKKQQKPIRVKKKFILDPGIILILDYVCRYEK